ncbi:hypothetical protein EV714DRAFT_272296 [Schizophyllum commune]
MSDHGADNDLQALLDFGRRVCVPTQVIEDISDLPYLATIARVAQWSFDSIPLVRATDDARIQVAEALLIVLGNLLDIIRTAEVALTPSELQLLTRVVSALESVYAKLREFLPGAQSLDDDKVLEWLDCKFLVADIISETEAEETLDDRRLGSLEECQKRIQQTAEDLVNIVKNRRPECSRQITVVDKVTDEALLAKRCEYLLPSIPAHTLDRSRLREHIVSSIARSAGPVYHCVLGSAGVGKTTFVRSLLRDHQVIARYAYRRFYVACDDARSVDNVVTKICAQLGCMRRGRWRRLLPRPALLVLDGLDGLTTSARHSLALESFLSRCCRTQGLSLIVTLRGPRRPRNIPWTTPLLPPLDNLSLSEAEQLCRWKAPVLTPDQVQELFGLCDGHVMALTLLATSASYEGFSRCMDRWRARARREHIDATPTLDVIIAFAIRSLHYTNPMPDPRLRRRKADYPLVLLELASLLPTGLSHRVAEELPVFETAKPRTWSGYAPDACYDASLNGNTDYLPDMVYLRAREAKLVRMGLARREGDFLVVPPTIRAHIMAARPEVEVEPIALSTFDLPSLVRYADWLPMGDTLLRIGELLLGARHLALHAMEEGEVVEEAVGCAIDTAYIGAATGWRVSDFITNDIVRRAVEDEGNPRLHVRYLLCLSRVVRGEGDAVLQAMEIAREEKMPGCEALCHIRLAERICDAAAASIGSSSRTPQPPPLSRPPTPQNARPPSHIGPPRPPPSEHADYLSRAASHALEAIPLAHEGYDSNTEFHALQILATIRIHQRRPHLALSSLLAAVHVAPFSRNVVLESRALARVAWVKFLIGDGKAALKISRGVVKQLMALDADPVEERCHLAEILLGCGHFDEARRVASVVLGRRNGSRRARVARAHARVILVKVALARGESLDAEKPAREVARAYAVCVREGNERGALACRLAGAQLVVRSATSMEEAEHGRQLLLQCLETRATWAEAHATLGDMAFRGTVRVPDGVTSRMPDTASTEPDRAIAQTHYILSLAAAFLECDMRRVCAALRRLASVWYQNDCEGRVDDSAGRTNDSEEHPDCIDPTTRLDTASSILQAALSGFEWTGMAHERAEAMLGMGDILWAHAVRNEARRWWRRAWDVFSACGLGEGAVRCRERLQRVG